MKAKLFLATDHAGFEHKNFLSDCLHQQVGFNYEVVDLGAFVYDKHDDYPGIIARAACRVATNPELHRAVVFGGSGQGEAMVANKYPGVRATVYYGHENSIVSLGREHNNSNVLSLGARFVKKENILQIVSEWLDGDFANESRHARRIDSIKEIEKKLSAPLWLRYLRGSN